MNIKSIILYTLLCSMIAHTAFAAEQTRDDAWQATSAFSTFKRDIQCAFSRKGYSHKQKRRLLRHMLALLGITALVYTVRRHRAYKAQIGEEIKQINEEMKREKESLAQILKKIEEEKAQRLREINKQEPPKADPSEKAELEEKSRKQPQKEIKKKESRTTIAVKKAKKPFHHKTGKKGQEREELVPLSEVKKQYKEAEHYCIERENQLNALIDEKDQKIREAFNAARTNRFQNYYDHEAFQKNRAEIEAKYRPEINRLRQLVEPAWNRKNELSDRLSAARVAHKKLYPE